MIRIQNMTFGYKKSKEKVFSNFSLDLNTGCVYGLLGKNATGKSTLLNLISGLLFPEKGEITIDGEQIQTRSEQLLEKIFFVPEEFQLPKRKLKHFVAMYSPFYKNFSHEILENCMREFELSPDLRLDKISMGTKKKVMMSFALATNTEVLLLDEPTNGLDIPSKRLFRKVIVENIFEGRTIIISTHQIHDVESLLDHVVIVGKEGLLLDDSVYGLVEKYTFGTTPAGEVLHCEKTLEGDFCLARRINSEEETPIHLEFLFEAVTQKPTIFKL